MPPSARTVVLFMVPALALGLAVPLAQAADELAPERFFELNVRPVLAEHCQKCHGSETQKGGLRLDSRVSALEGGDSGPAVVPGKLDESLLVEAVHHDGLRMPPKTRLESDQIQVLERWVEMGAPWPDSAGSTPTRPTAEFTAEDRAWWAFQPLKRPEPPIVSRQVWNQNPIDAFILAKLEENALEPAPEADRATLIRRLSFDLLGLPPSPEEVQDFVDDSAPDAYERLVDRMLESPQYGERLARLWLDLVRYAESDGYKADYDRPEAWRYRDYVVRSFNQDKPYDRFLTEQLAGDEIDPDDPELRTATQYLRLWPYEYNQRDVWNQRQIILNDITDVTADVVLGLGFACARCHNHKFDPILQRDYFRLQAFFTPLLPRDDLPLDTVEHERDRRVETAAWELMTAEIREEIGRIEAPHRAQARKDAIAKYPAETKAVILKDPSERSPLERQIAYLAERQILEEFTKIDTRIKGDERKRYDELQKQLATFDRYKPKEPPPAFTATDVGPEAPDTVIPGDRRGEPIEPGFLTLLEPGPASIETPAPDSHSTGRRLTLARWITKPDHPLTSRVMVNRIWQKHFGTGLVATSSDFGRLGEPPSHPELLDWLAVQFVQEGWSLKTLTRRIVTSQTYRQASARSPEALESALRIDPENRLLWHRQVTRLDAEQVRDAMLSASGELEARKGGPSADGSKPRRSLYVAPEAE